MLVGVVIIKGAGWLDIVGWLGGFNSCAIAFAASFTRCKMTIESKPIITSGLNGKSPVFSQDLHKLCLFRASI
jgi:hypothetical protein